MMKLFFLLLFIFLSGCCTSEQMNHMSLYGHAHFGPYNIDDCEKNSQR